MEQKENKREQKENARSTLGAPAPNRPRHYLGLYLKCYLRWYLPVLPEVVPQVVPEVVPDLTKVSPGSKNAGST